MPKGIYQRHPTPPKRRAPRKVQMPQNKVVIAQAPGISIGMSRAEAARQIGRSKGGQARARANTGHTFTSETARAAARKLWDKDYPLRGFQGRPTATGPQVRVRIGKKVGRRPAVNRKALRARYAECPTNGIEYHPEAGYWTRTDDHMCNLIGERTALRQLGHLPYPRKGLVPETIIDVPLTAKMQMAQQKR